LFSPSTHLGFQRIRLTSDDLTFDEMDEFENLTKGKTSSSAQLRALAVLGCRRQGIEITFEDLASLKISEVVDVDFIAGQVTAKADPTVAGA
jgi:predicted double-glycine peptidase